MGFVYFLLGCLISWLITHLYYKKNLKDQRISYEKTREDLANQLKTLSPNNTLLVREARIEAALRDYKGTPKHVIDTFTDLSEAEKAILFDDVLMRKKGRKSKNNPYNTPK